MAETNVPSLKIALIAEQQSTYSQLGYSEDECAALTHDGEIQAVSISLQKLGHHVTLVPGIQSLVQRLAAGENKQWDLAFNMAQGFYGSAREVQVPALLEAYRIPCTFADAATMALCQNKATSKIVLAHNNIPTSPFLVIKSERLVKSPSSFTSSLSNYPLFIKPVNEGSSKGIDGFNKVHKPAELDRALQSLKFTLPDQDILVESFLSGREFTVSILGTGAFSRVIGIREFIWQQQKSPSDGDSSNSCDPTPQDLDYTSRKSKSSKGDYPLVCNDLLDMHDSHIGAACQVALDAWNVFGCRDAGRVDIRFDSDKPDSVPNVLEVNPISGLLPGHSPLPASAAKNGTPFEELLTAIIESALRRARPER